MAQKSTRGILLYATANNLCRTIPSNLAYNRFLRLDPYLPMPNFFYSSLFALRRICITCNLDLFFQSTARFNNLQFLSILFFAIFAIYSFFYLHNYSDYAIAFLSVIHIIIKGG